ncbi:glycosyltransferase [Streptomyces sp. CA-288835]|uniref:glycosyltransferase n=1 Tax=Streptomyces sp. CA-288835 TaxID=3240069 RepID=UPI003D94F46C
MGDSLSGRSGLSGLSLIEEYGLPGAGRAHEPVPSVAVLVELLRNGASGGHVKCWEHFAEAAAQYTGPGPGIDLTVYVLGERESVEPLSPRVRFVSLRPVLSTAALMPAVGGVDIVDLAPFHPRLARLLPRHDVWHVTHTFAFASTAALLVRRADRATTSVRPGVVGSLHTDVPALAAVYLKQMLGRSPGLAWMDGRFPGGGAPAAVAWLARRRRDRLIRMCDRVLVASPHDRTEITALTDPGRVSQLRRGIDRERFRPDPWARGALARAHGVPVDRPLILFVGRVDASKRALLLAEAVDRMRRQGHAVHLLMVGPGADRGRVADLLGPDVTLLAPQPQEWLARVYAGCDVFAFPSRTETVGNVVAEAMACRLPVVLPAGARTTQWLAGPGRDGLVVRNDDAEGWAQVLTELVTRPELRRVVGERAVATARHRHPTWAQVFADDLVPVWHEALRLRGSHETAGPVGAGPAHAAEPHNVTPRAPYGAP